jgi:DNA replication protein DnaC
MKQTNLKSILDGYDNLNPDLFKAYLSYHSINIKNDELEDLAFLVKDLESLNNDIEILDNYFLGYIIPQIGKEFDLLRIGSDSIVNIELKRESTLPVIKKQLVQNKYYLSFLKKESHHFTYVSSDKKIYKLDKNENIKEVSIRTLMTRLASQELEDIKDIDSLFNPSNYLVSPFNSTREFITKKYFLTSHQEQIKKTTLKQLTLLNYSILAITGKAGTGKTLLTYDIANEVYDLGKKVLIIHCGILNDGHRILINKYFWDIIPIKHLNLKKLSTYDLIIVDEAQRIYTNQLNSLIKKVKELSINCIFSYDGLQTLRKEETDNNIPSKIKENLTLSAFKLTTKIRTNKEVATFIKCLLSKKEIIHKLNYSNIELHYFENRTTAKEYLQHLSTSDWKIVNNTPSQYKSSPYDEYNLAGEDTVHNVIGQEFDNVVAVIGKHFYYNDEILSNKFRGSYYHRTKMLFQILSRTKIKLKLVIINNQELLERCLKIMDKSTSR